MCCAIPRKTRKRKPPQGNGLAVTFLWLSLRIYGCVCGRNSDAAWWSDDATHHRFSGFERTCRTGKTVPPQIRNPHGVTSAADLTRTLGKAMQPQTRTVHQQSTPQRVLWHPSPRCAEQARRTQVGSRELGQNDRLSSAGADAWQSPERTIKPGSVTKVTTSHRRQ